MEARAKEAGGWKRLAMEAAAEMVEAEAKEAAMELESARLLRRRRRIEADMEAAAKEGTAGARIEGPLSALASDTERNLFTRLGPERHDERAIDIRGGFTHVGVRVSDSRRLCSLDYHLELR